MTTQTASTLPVLKTTRKTLESVSYKDLAEFISRVTGQPYTSSQMLADQEWSNGSRVELDVSEVHEDEEEGPDLVSDFLAGKRPMYVVGPLLTYLCQKGLVPKGTYLVDVYY